MLGPSDFAGGAARDPCCLTSIVHLVRRSDRSIGVVHIGCSQARRKMVSSPGERGRVPGVVEWCSRVLRLPRARPMRGPMAR